MRRIFIAAFTMLNSFLAFSAHAEVENDTTTVPLRKVIIVNDPVGGDTGSHSPIFIPTVYISIIADYISIDTDDFTEDYITLTISDDMDEIIYINENIQNTYSVTQIDISSLPIGAYIISIKDGDDEYVGEFEVY
jgi:hypothetical protein